MKALQFLIVPAVSSCVCSCAYTARDLYRDAHEICLRNTTSAPAKCKVYSWKGDILSRTIAGPGENRALIYYKSFVMEKETVTVSVYGSKGAKDYSVVFDPEEKLRFLELWHSHTLTY